MWMSCDHHQTLSKWEETYIWWIISRYFRLYVEKYCIVWFCKKPEFKQEGGSVWDCKVIAAINK